LRLPRRAVLRVDDLNPPGAKQVLSAVIHRLFRLHDLLLEETPREE